MALTLKQTGTGKTWTSGSRKQEENKQTTGANTAPAAAPPAAPARRTQTWQAGGLTLKRENAELPAVPQATAEKPAEKRGFFSRLGDTIRGGAKGSMASNSNAMSTFYAMGQGGRDAQNREYLAEYSHNLERAKLDMDAMLAENKEKPGSWNERDIQSQQYIIDDWQRKYDAMAKVLDEQVQQKATQASYEMADDIQQSSAQDIERAKEGLGGVGRVLVDAGASMTQTALDTAANALLGTPGSMGAFAMRAFGGGTQQARQDSPNSTLEQQVLYGTASAAKEVFTEKMFNIALPFSHAYGGGALDDAVERGIRSAVNRFAKTDAGKRVLGGALTFGAGAVGEGLEEFIGDWMEWQMPRIYGGDAASAGETLENSLYDFLVGAASGMMGGVITPATYHYNVGETGTQQETTAPAPQTEATPQATAANELLTQAAEQASQNGSIHGKMADRILADQDAMAALEQAAGQVVQDGMTKSQQRKAVKNAVATLARTQSDVSANARETAPTATEARQTATQETVRPAMQVEQQRPAAQQAYDIRRVQDAAASLGENGAKALSASYDGSVRADDYYAGFASYYEAGINGADMARVDSDYGSRLTEAQRFAAYSAGQNDAALSLQREQQAAKYAKVAGEDSGLVYDDFVKQAVESGRPLQDKQGRAILDANGESRVYLTAETAAKVNRVAKALGVRVQFVDSVRGGTANAQISGSTVLVERNNENPVLAIVGHEMTHRMQELAPTEYRTFRDIVAQEEQDSIQKRIDSYATQGVELTYEQAMDEVAADYAGRLIDDGKVLDDFIERHRDDRTLLQKVRDAIRSLIDKLTGAEKKKAQTAEGKLTAALEAAARQAKTLQGEGGNDTMAATRNSLKEDGKDGQESETGGRPGTGSREGYGQSADREGKGQDGRVRRELSAASGRHGGVNPSFGAKPVRSWAEGHTVEPAKGSVAYAEQRTAVDYGVPSFVVADAAWAKNKGSTPAFSADGQIFFRETLPEKNRGMFAPHEVTHVMRQVGYKPYLDFVERTPTMLNMSDGMTRVLLNHVAEHQHTTLENADPARLYDEFNATMYGHIAAGKADMFVDGPAAHVFHDFDAYAKELGELHERFKADNQKETKFSLKTPVEETDKLLALHNKDENSILAAIKLGGLPMPSIAIVKARDGHTKYGPISLVFSKDTIDPQLFRANKVYGGDAWTPTAPRVDYPVNSKKASQVEHELHRLAGDISVAGGIFGNSAALRSMGIDDTSTRSTAELAEKLASTDTVRAAYLADKGKSLEPVKMDKVWDKFGNDTLQKVFDRLGVNTLAEIEASLETGESVKDALGENAEAIRDILRDYYREQGEPMLRRMAAKRGWTNAEINERRQTRIDNSMDGVSIFTLEDIVHHAWDMYQDGGATKGEIDRMATSDALRSAVDDHAVEEWIAGKLDGLLGEAGIYNGKDPYTPSGNLRSFSQLHYAYTLENIVKAMKEGQEERGGNTWGASAKTLQSVATPEYRSIQEIKADSGRLGMDEGAEYEAKLQAIDDQIGSIITKIKQGNKAHSDNSFVESDIIGSILVETAKSKKTVDAIMRAFSKEGYKISSQTAQDIQAAYKAAAEMPTGYFEAKPQRAVGFDEVLAAVIPDDSSKKLRDGLEQAGVRMLEYKTGDDADRLVKINSVDNARFSLKSGEKVYNQTVVLEENTIDTYLKDYAAKSSPKYAKAYITYMDPDVFVALTTSEDGRWLVEATSKPLNAEKLGEASRWQPIQLNIDHETGEVQGHEGRHRATAMLRAGIENIPVLLFDSSNKYSKENIGELLLHGQDFGNTRSSAAAYVYDLMPLSYANRDAIVQRFTNPPQGEQNGESLRYSLKAGTESKSVAALQEENRLLREQMKDYIALQRRNGTLQESRDYWRGQTRRTQRATTDKKAVTAAAKQLIQNYGADIAVKDIQGDLQSLYDYIASGYDGKDELTYTEARRRAEDIAQTLVSNAVAVDSDMYDAYSDLRDYLRTTKIIYGKEYHGDIADYGDFRKRQFGRLNLGSEGHTNIDQVYQELSSRWPEFFSEQEQTHPTDQLLHIVEVLDGISEINEYNPFSRYMDQAVTGAANEIMEAFFDLPQTRKTFADRQALKLENAKAKGREQVQKVREQYATRLAELREQNRQRVQNAIAKEREARERQMGALKDRYAAKDAAGRERRAARELRAKITRHASALSQKLLRPSDQHHIPEAMRGSVAAMLESINQESQYTLDENGKLVKDGSGTPTKRTEAFRALKEQYAKIVAEGGDMVIDPSLLGSDADGIKGGFDAVIAMKDTKLADMSVAQLQTVWQVVKAVEHSVNTAGKVLSKAKYARTADWAQAISIGTSSRRAKGSLTRNHALIDLETPYTFFSHYGEAGKAVYRMLRDAQDQQQLMVDHVAEEVRKIVDPKTVKKLEATTQTFTTERGEKLTLSTAQVMELYELVKRKQAHDHLLKGGVVQPEIKTSQIRRGTDSIRLTEGDLANITGTLTPEQVKIADGLQGLTTGVLADYGNKASMEAYGYKKFTESDYWPIKSAKEGLHSNIEKGGNNTRSIKNIGMAKTTMPHASNALDLAGIFTTFANHASDMTDYASWLCTMEDINRLFNYQFRDEEGNPTGKTIKSLLDRVGGPNSQAYWHNLMEDIQNGINARSDTASGYLIDKTIGGFKGAAVGANVRVVIQQPTAFFRAAAVLDPQDMARGLARGVTRGNGWKKALQYSPIAMRKDAGGFDISSPYQMTETLFDNRTNVRKLNDVLSAPAGAADAVTWGKLWNACEWATAREHQGLTKGSEAFYRQTAKLFAEVIDQTQVVDGVLQRSQIMRSSNAIYKQATSFMGEPIMSLNLLMRAYDQVRYEQNSQKRGKAIKTMGRAATALVVTNVVNALAQSLIDAMRDDDEDKKYWERFRAAFTGISGDEETPWEKAWNAIMEGNVGSNMNPLGQIPFVKDALSIMQGYDVSRTEMEIVSDLIQAGQTAIQSADGQGKRTRAYALKGLLAAGAKMFGIPAYNLTRDMWGLARSAAVETGNIPLQYEMEKAIYNISNTGNKSRYYAILYRALEQGDMDTYQHIRDDLMNSMGVDGASIDSAMRSRYNKAVEKDPDYTLPQRARDLIGSRDKYAPAKEKEETFGADDLGSSAYQAYSDQRANDYRSMADDLASSPIFRGMDDETRDKVLKAAYDLADKSALEDHSDGQYEISTKWMAQADDAEAQGIEPWEYVLFHTAYNEMEGTKDADGKTVKGEAKSDHVREWLEDFSGLTDEQRAFLWGTVYTSEW